MWKLNEHRLKGNEHYKQRQYEEAIQAYTAGLEEADALEKSMLIGALERNTLDDARNKLHVNRGQAHAALENWIEAEQDAREALNVSHTNYKAYFVLGKALMRQGRHEEAQKRLNRASALAETAADREEIFKLILDSKRLHWMTETDKKRQMDEHLRLTLEKGNPLTEEERERLMDLLDSEKARIDHRKVPPYLVCPVNNVSPL
eukprot:Blabericola_migrator_1__9464@NODE_5131_length_865_cov_196_946115_g3257_i0_p1_GENE_NODE_5131_length_865_cov_196_946115_g3257_i0NODE_5131_length_865_cov_196_946115_g3257_i0_p1_ORF_typecomplete_len204_score37_27TPR_2/PF07719_17/0_00039TPR_2/PF07719_17/0_0015TPR_2/PF07719_17/0_00019TPR_16/PF13432_6/1_8e05TPR_16/PF13432_6/3_7e08TPR_1/PF00515_28/0_00059TPR_1/PF00515_28/0_14TPR_1/PF00515_28/0_022TPR_MalT/PF17874_1/1_6e09ANAPC3/PF12895_7/0_44ANAPC3/PF12895_7/3_5e06TPR_8/PF13181_6/1_3TPR_8/PF13181_6/9_9T